MGEYKVYIHTTPDGRKYVGMTKQKVELRWCDGKGYKQKYFRNAINCFGWENIKHEIIAENLNEEDACKMEVFLIQKYKTTNRKYGYNTMNGNVLPRGKNNKSFWKTFLGEELYAKMNEYLSNKKMSIATLVRLAIEQYIKD